MAGGFLPARLSTVQNNAMNTQSDTSLSFTGRVMTGQGRGANFTQLARVREQFLQSCGIDPFPGTLNLTVSTDTERETWRRLQGRGGRRMAAPADEACTAILYPVRIADSLTGAIVRPEVDGYPADRVEIIAAVDLRQHLRLADGDIVAVALLEPHAVKAAIFDVDGTLLNSLEGYRLAASRATRAHGYSVSLDHVRRALNSDQPFWDFIIPPGQRDDADLLAELRAATMRHWPAALQEVVGVIPGCTDSLDRLRRSGIRLALVTGSGGESFPVLRAAGLLDLFEVIVTGNDVRARKPDPEGIRLCLDKLGLAAKETVYVGDSCIDVAASHAAGALSVSVLTGAGDCATLCVAGTDRILTSMAQLPEVLTAVIPTAAGQGPQGLVR